MFLGFSKNVMLAWTAASLVLATGCASPSLKTADSKRVQALQRRLKKQSSVIQDLKDRNLVLEKRDHSRASDVLASDDVGESIADPAITSDAPADLPKSFAAAPKISNVVARKPAAAAAPIMTPKVASPAPDAISVSPEKTGEHFLYSKVLETYRSKNSAELEKTLSLLLKTYPDSVFADNAIYMSGLLSFESGDDKAALKQFDRLLKDYPRSNKAVAALFAKASIEKRTGRTADAKRAFLQLKDLYPGSPEAARVSVELKLLESASLKHRES